MTAIALWTGYEILMLKDTSQPEVLLLYGVRGGYEAPTVRAGIVAENRAMRRRKKP